MSCKIKDFAIFFMKMSIIFNYAIDICKKNVNVHLDVIF